MYIRSAVFTVQRYCVRRKVSLKTETHSPRAGTLEKRKAILDAAVKVFAKKGYYGCRVSDIAEEAGVAYGLVYHYFKSKELVLNSIFQERWSVFIEFLRRIDESGDPIEKKLRTIVSYMIDGYRLNPEMMEVVILEISRSSKFYSTAHTGLVNEAMKSLDRMLTKGLEARELRSNIDTKTSAYLFFGMIETVLTGFVLGAVKASSEADFARIKNEVVETFLNGIRAR